MVTTKFDTYSNMYLSKENIICIKLKLILCISDKNVSANKPIRT